MSFDACNTDIFTGSRDVNKSLDQVKSPYSIHVRNSLAVLPCTYITMDSMMSVRHIFIYIITKIGCHRGKLSYPVLYLPWHSVHVNFLVNNVFLPSLPIIYIRKMFLLVPSLCLQCSFLKVKTTTKHEFNFLS